MAKIPQTTLAQMSPSERASLLNLLDKLRKPRNGVIVSFTGIRAGTWKSFNDVFTIESNIPEVKNLLESLKREGLYIEVPTRVIGVKKAPENSSMSAHALRKMPLGQASVGQVDMILKRKGYFLIELDSLIA